MSIQEIDPKVQELRELQAMVEEATAQIEAIKDANVSIRNDSERTSWSQLLRASGSIIVS